MKAPNECWSQELGSGNFLASFPHSSSGPRQSLGVRARHSLVGAPNDPHSICRKRGVQADLGHLTYYDLTGGFGELREASVLCVA